MKPKISIIVAVYNANVCLERCFDILRMQDLPELEIICVDDCSTDNSYDILKMMALRDPRIVLKKTAKRSGLGVARNLGMKLAHGEYIGFMTPDGGMPANFFSSLYNVACEKKANVAFSSLMIAMPDGKMVNPQFSDANCMFQFRPWRGIFKASYLKKINAKFAETFVLDTLPFEQAVILNMEEVVVLNQLFFTEHMNPHSAENAMATVQDLADIEQMYSKFWEAMNTRDMSPQVYMLTLTDRFAFLRDAFYYRLLDIRDKVRLLELMIKLYRLTQYNKGALFADDALIMLTERHDILRLIDFMEMRRVNQVRRYMVWRRPWMVVEEQYRFKMYKLFGRIKVWRRILIPRI